MGRGLPITDECGTNPKFRDLPGEVGKGSQDVRLEQVSRKVRAQWAPPPPSARNSPA